MGTAPACARDALDMVRAGLGYLADADAAQLATATQAECLRELPGSGRSAAVSTSALGQCSAPRGMTRSSRGLSAALPSRIWIFS